MHFKALASDCQVIKTCSTAAAGGANGSNNYFEIIRSDGKKEGPFGIVARKVINKGDYVRMVTATGGGYGNPLHRSISSVIDDVKNDYISREQAAEDYRVNLNEDLNFVSESPDRIAAQLTLNCLTNQTK